MVGERRAKMLFWHTQPEHYNQHSTGSYLR